MNSDEEDFEDFEEADREKDPEYFLTDEQVNQAFKEMSDTERQYFLELKQFHQVDYLQRGQIRPLSEYIRELNEVAQTRDSYPDPGNTAAAL